MCWAKADQLDQHLQRMAVMLSEQPRWKAALARYPALLMRDPDDLTTTAHAVAAEITGDDGDSDEAAEKRVKLVAAHPWLLACRPDAIGAKVEALANNLGVEVARARRVVLTYPSVLGLAAETIGAKLVQLANNLDIDVARAQRVALTCPSVLGLAPESIGAKLEALANNLDVELARAQRVALTYASVLSLAPDTIGDKLGKLANNLDVEVERAPIDRLTDRYAKKKQKR